MAWRSLSEILDLADEGGAKHSNSKVALFVVTAAVLVSWGILKYFGKDITWPDVALLVSLILAAGSIRALLAFWKIRANGGSPNGPTRPF